jgi:hypothetical protein
MRQDQQDHGTRITTWSLLVRRLPAYPTRILAPDHPLIFAGDPDKPEDMCETPSANANSLTPLSLVTNID